MTQPVAREFGRHDMFCPNCKHIGKPRRVKPGSFLIEVILWVFVLIVGGLIYTIWRIRNTHDVCALCGNRNIIPARSPEAQRMMP